MSKILILFVNLLVYLAAVVPGLLFYFSFFRPEVLPASTNEQLQTIFHSLLRYSPFLLDPSSITPASDGFPAFLAYAADILGTLVVYILCICFDNSSLYDNYWSVSPPVLFVLYLDRAMVKETFVLVRAILVGIVVFYWSIRLTGNCFSRWHELSHEDWRYRSFRKYDPLIYWIVSLFGFHLLPTFLVFAGCLSIFVALLIGDAPLNWFDWLAFAFGIMATTLQLVADNEMNQFLREKQAGHNKAPFLDQGTWAYSRHPNYLGEILFWCSLFLFALASCINDLDDGWLKVAFIGPVSIICLFVFISIPMMDERSIQRRPGYAEYAKKTPALIWF